MGNNSMTFACAPAGCLIQQSDASAEAEIATRAEELVKESPEMPAFLAMEIARGSGSGGRAPQLLMFTTRCIEAGEELCWDYGEEYWERAAKQGRPPPVS